MVGVPLITQVVLWILNPSGSVGEIVQELMADPLVFRVDGETLITDATVPVVPVELE